HVLGQRPLEQLRLRELERDRERHEDRPRGEQLAVRPDVDPQPADQPDVVRAAGDDVGFGRGAGHDYGALTSSSAFTTLIGPLDTRSVSICVRYSARYTPSCASSSSWVPRATSLP